MTYDAIVKVEIPKLANRFQTTYYNCWLSRWGHKAYRAVWSEGEYLKQVMLRKVQSGSELTVAEVEKAFEVYGRECRKDEGTLY